MEKGRDGQMDEQGQRQTDGQTKKRWTDRDRQMMDRQRHRDANIERSQVNCKLPLELRVGFQS